jgi:membrane dipeptidase
VIFMIYWLMPHETKRGLDFIINVGGIDAVAFGSDFDGFTDPPDDMKDAQELPRLTQRLIAESYTEEEIKKILGHNIIRVFKEASKK